MKILVTGATGFVGRHLVPQLIGHGHEVVPTSSRRITDMRQLDVTNLGHCAETVQSVKPDVIVNLAGQSMVKTSWDKPGEFLNTNTIGISNLFQAVVEASVHCRIIGIGSGEEYGLSGQSGVPLYEDEPCNPRNPYALSKLSAGMLGLQLAKRYGISFTHLRPFNHFGPGQRQGFVVSDFASKIAMLERGKGQVDPILTVGNLDARRDFLPVNDVAFAYLSVVEDENATGIYNVCSGVDRSIRDILDILVDAAEINIQVEVDPGLLRPMDTPVFVGANDKLRNMIQWVPSTSMQCALQETLNWWREQV